MLTEQEIRAANLIIGGGQDGYRPSSYDLRIGQIVTNDVELHANFKLLAQGIVQVVSIERVRVPPNITGIATVKTGLCNLGILALNIGIIDPGYEGRISSFLVNFSKEPIVLMRGNPFLRLQFMPLPGFVPPPNGVHPPQTIDDRTYIAQRRQSAALFSNTFLNLSESINSVVSDEISKWGKIVLSAAGAAGLLLAMFTFFLNWSSLAMVKGWLQPADTIRAELYRGELNDQISQLKKINNELNERMKALETRAHSTPPTTPQP